MKKNYFSVSFILMILFLTLNKNAYPAQVPKEIKICSPEWDTLTLGGKGLYFDLWNEIYTKNGVKLTIITDGFKRCANFLKTTPDKVDAIPESYFSEEFYTPQWNSSNDVITVLTRKNSFPSWEKSNSINIQDLKGKTIAWVSGYDFDKSEAVLVPLDGNKKPLFTIKEITEKNFNDGIALLLLLQGKVDAIYDYPDSIKLAKSNLKPEDKIEFEKNTVQFTDALIASKLYMNFAKTDNGKIFMQMWDKGMEQLSKEPGENNTSKLNTIYKKWGNPAYK